jgi:hypothetical protein
MLELNNFRPIDVLENRIEEALFKQYYNAGPSRLYKVRARKNKAAVLQLCVPQDDTVAVIV